MTQTALSYSKNEKSRFSVYKRGPAAAERLMARATAEAWRGSAVWAAQVEAAWVRLGIARHGARPATATGLALGYANGLRALSASWAKRRAHDECPMWQQPERDLKKLSERRLLPPLRTLSPEGRG